MEDCVRMPPCGSELGPGSLWASNAPADMRSCGRVGMAKAAPNNQNSRREREFAHAVRQFFEREGILLTAEHPVDIAVADERRPHCFDLGSDDPPILVECKRHTWTEGSKKP